MADLEALSNKELRKKCIEFGMPNVPVTDSSRKILIRRLEAAMSGKPITTTPAKANRRETMHVSKPSEVSSSPKITVSNTETKPATTNRTSRRTIAAAPERHVVTTTTVSEPEYSDVSPDRGEPEPIKAKTPEKPPKLYPKLPAKEPSPKPQQLSKTGVVTTSYVQETAPVNKIYALPDEVDLVEDFIVEDQFVQKTGSNIPKLSYVPVSEARVTTTAPLTTNLSSSTRYSSLDSYSYNKPNYLSSTNVRKTYIPSSGGYNMPLGARQYPTTTEDEIEDDYDYEDDDVVLVEESPIKDAETPYLSQFARNLETLKATPLRHSVGPTKITPPKSILRNRDLAYSRRTIGSPLSNINTRRPIQTSNDSSFHHFILAMEEKYHLKHSLILISIFILVVFIYVFFIQSV